MWSHFVRRLVKLCLPIYQPNGLNCETNTTLDENVLLCSLGFTITSSIVDNYHYKINNITIATIITTPGKF